MRLAYPWICLSLLPFPLRAESLPKDLASNQNTSTAKLQGFLPFSFNPDPKIQVFPAKFLVGVEQGANLRSFQKRGFLKHVKQVAQKLRVGFGFALPFTETIENPYAGFMIAVSLKTPPHTLYFLQLCPSHRRFSCSTSFKIFPFEEVPGAVWAANCALPIPSLPLTFVGNFLTTFKVREESLIDALVFNLNLYFNLGQYACFLKREDGFSLNLDQEIGESENLKKHQGYWSLGIDFSKKSEIGQIFMEPGWLPMQSALLLSEIDQEEGSFTGVPFVSLFLSYKSARLAAEKQKELIRRKREDEMIMLMEDLKIAASNKEQYLKAIIILQTEILQTSREEKLQK